MLLSLEISFVDWSAQALMTGISSATATGVRAAVVRAVIAVTYSVIFCNLM